MIPDGKSVWLHNAVGFIPIIGSAPSSSCVFLMYMTFNADWWGTCVFGRIVEPFWERGIAEAEPLAAQAPGLCQVSLSSMGAIRS